MVELALSTGIFLGLAALIAWGTADFVARFAIKKVGPFTTLLFMQIAGLFPILAWALVVGIPSISMFVLLLAIISSFLMIFSYLMFYKSIDKGKLSLVSPVGSSWGVVTALLSIAFLAERPGIYQIIGIIIIFIGLFLSSIDLKEFISSIKGRFFEGVPEALTAMLGWGFAFFVLIFVINSLGAIWAALVTHIIAILLLAALPIIGASKIVKPNFQIWPALIIIGLLDAGAFIAYNFGITTELASIVSPIAAAFPAVTITLAYVFLNERLHNHQKLGVGLILLGLVSLALV